MSSNNVCFCSVYYEEALPYIRSFAISLKKQTYKDFDLLLFVDGVLSDEVKKEFKSLRVFFVKVEGKPALIRSQLLDYLKRSDYKYVIFGDIDDFFMKDRVSDSLHLLKRYDIVVHDVNLTNEDGIIYETNFWKNRFLSSQEFTIKDILDSNFVGLGNTSIRISCLPEDINFPENIIAVDWFLFSKMLFLGAKAIFSNKATVCYRQYPNNTIGLKRIDIERINKGVQVKIAHYASLVVFNAIFEEKEKAVLSLKKKLKDSFFKDRYLLKVKKEILSNPFWWEEVKI